eukprot:PhM_4_TR1317/c6_g1_i1/m.52836
MTALPHASAPPSTRSSSSFVSSFLTMVVAAVFAAAVGYFLLGVMDEQNRIQHDKEFDAAVTTAPEKQQQQQQQPSLSSSKLNWDKFITLLGAVGVDTSAIEVRFLDEDDDQRDNNGDDVPSVFARGNITLSQVLLSLPKALLFAPDIFEDGVAKSIESVIAASKTLDAAETPLFYTFFALMFEKFASRKSSPWYPWFETLPKATDHFFNAPVECFHQGTQILHKDTLAQFSRFWSVTQRISSKGIVGVKFTEAQAKVAFVNVLAGSIWFDNVPTLVPLISNYDALPYATEPLVRPGAVWQDPAAESEGAGQTFVDFISTRGMDAAVSQTTPLTFRSHGMTPEFTTLLRGRSDLTFKEHDLWVAWDDDEAMHSHGCFSNATANTARRNGVFSDHVWTCAQLQVLTPKHERGSYDFQLDFVQLAAYDFLLSHADLALASIPESCARSKELHHHNKVLRTFFEAFKRRVSEKKKSREEALELIERMKDTKPGEMFATEYEKNKNMNGKDVFDKKDEI